MALAQSMKNFVNDLKASNRSRHAFVKGNRELTKSMVEDNRKFIQNIHSQNQSVAQQTRDILQSSREVRHQGFKTLMDTIHSDLGRIHQAKEAISQGAKGMMKEFREDNALAHKYWMSTASDEPIEEPKAAATKSVKKAIKQ
ncbi:MAG: hypothetical protein ABIC82_04635 [bacterium]